MPTTEYTRKFCENVFDLRVGYPQYMLFCEAEQGIGRCSFVLLLFSLRVVTSM